MNEANPAAGGGARQVFGGARVAAIVIVLPDGFDHAGDVNDGSHPAHRFVKRRGGRQIPVHGLDPRGQRGLPSHQSANGLAGRSQAIDNMTADKTCAAGDERHLPQSAYSSELRKATSPK